MLRRRQASQALQKRKQPPLPLDKAPAPGSPDRSWWLILFFFAFALYANTLVFKYALDDAIVITENAFTKQGIGGIPKIMTNEGFTGFFGENKMLVAGGRYRPLSLAVFAIEYEFFGLNPFFGHLTNVLLYSLIAVLLFRLLLRLIPPRPQSHWSQSIPFLGTALFIAHPLHTEVIANIKGLDEILSLLFSLLTLQQVLKFVDKKKITALIWAGIFFLFALLSKENAITFLAVIPLCLYFFRKSPGTHFLITLLPLFASTIIYLLLRYNALGYLWSMDKAGELLNDPYLFASQSEKWATNIFTWGKYFLLLVFPHPLTHDYYPWHIQMHNWNSPAVILSLVLSITLIIIALMGLKRKSLPSFSIIFFLLTFSVSSNIILNIGTFMNERFLFIPLLGFTLILAWLIAVKLPAIMGKKGAKTAMMLSFLIIIGLYSVKTVARNFDWKDDFTLFTKDVVTSSNSTKCNVSAGQVYLEKSKKENDTLRKNELLSLAENHLTRAVQIYDKNVGGWVLLGFVNLEQKDFLSAGNYFCQALSIQPEQADAIKGLDFAAKKTADLGLYNDGIRFYRTLNKVQPANRDHIVHLADMLSKTQRADSALLLLDAMIREDPSYAGYYSKKGEIFGRVYQDIPKAESLLLKAYSMKADEVTTLENLGIVNGIKGKYQLSLDFLNRALALDTSSSRILSNIGNTYAMMGDKISASSYFRRSQAAQAREKQLK